MEKTVTVRSVDMDAAKAKGKAYWEIELSKTIQLRSRFVFYFMTEVFQNDPDPVAMAELKFSRMVSDFEKWIDQTFPE